MPTPEARGEVARATMYLNTMYNLDITNNFTLIALTRTTQPIPIFTGILFRLQKQ